MLSAKRKLPRDEIKSVLLFKLHTCAISQEGEVGGKYSPTIFTGGLLRLGGLSPIPLLCMSHAYQPPTQPTVLVCKYFLLATKKFCSRWMFTDSFLAMLGEENERERICETVSSSYSFFHASRDETSFSFSRRSTQGKGLKCSSPGNFCLCQSFSINQSSEHFLHCFSFYPRRKNNVSLAKFSARNVPVTTECDRKICTFLLAILQ